MPTKFLMMPPQSSVTRDWARRLSDALPDYSVVVAETDQEAEAHIGDADAVFGGVPPDLLPKAAKLRWLHSPMVAPPAGYYYPELVAHPVAVTNIRGIYNDHIAAHILSYILAFSRALHLYFPMQAKREYRQLPRDRNGGRSTVHLPEATVLIVGVGEIGAEAGRLASAFGAKVVGVDARREELPPGMSELHKPEALDALLPKADFVVLTVPHTPVTEGFFNRAKFRLMKPTAYFINIGRGPTTRLDDLVAALDAGELAGAGLDVYEVEPLPADHALWKSPKVILTPHVAAAGPYLNERRFQIVLDNCKRFAANQPLRNIVDKNTWY